MIYKGVKQCKGKYNIEIYISDMASSTPSTSNDDTSTATGYDEDFESEYRCDICLKKKKIPRNVHTSYIVYWRQLAACSKTSKLDRVQTQRLVSC